MAKPRSNPRPRQVVSEEVQRSLLELIQRKFYQGQAVHFAKHRKDLLHMVIYWPAREWFRPESALGLERALPANPVGYSHRGGGVPTRPVVLPTGLAGEVGSGPFRDPGRAVLCGGKVGAVAGGSRARDAWQIDASGA
jgi:hypothetical protein